jgi:hypothetical protein
MEKLRITVEDNLGLNEDESRDEEKMYCRRMVM